ncbi:MAG: hypothetical protein SO053_04270 [Bifidobacterium animalis]|nr:hypothetical protein [Bifidobacterium animalis]MDY5040360.1 hypothetical protein [Bifidobacterium animalis]RYN12295.1 hypothetical protein PG2022B_1595 [Bifidobacterium animalis subsp. animalis]
MESKINIETSEDRAKVRELHNINSGIDETRNARWKPAHHESPAFFGDTLDKSIANLTEEYQESRENLKSTMQEYAEWLDDVINIFGQAETSQQDILKEVSARVDSADFASDVQKKEKSRSNSPMIAATSEAFAQMRSAVLDFLANTEKH